MIDLWAALPLCSSKRIATPDLEDACLTWFPNEGDCGRDRAVQNCVQFGIRNQVVNPRVFQPMALNASYEPANGSVTFPDHERSDDTEVIAEIADCRIEYELPPQIKQAYGLLNPLGLESESGRM
ncbi:MAG: hypothetical protein OXJ64_03875 [Boseongicola sp.]|nr:hypothetical protein [Boseongicola sp.]